MPSRRGFAAICFFPGNPPMFALEKRYNKTYGRRLGQDISDFLHMDRQRPDHERALFFGNTLFSDISLSTLKSKSGHNGFSWRAFRTQAYQVCQSLPEERRVKLPLYITFRFSTRTIVAWRRKGKVQKLQALLS